MIKFPYVALPSKLGKVYKPLIKVRFNYPKTHKVTLPVPALVDSGADVCFCSDFIGLWLGIQFNKIKKDEEFTAANGQTFKAKPAKIKIYIENIDYETIIYFTNVLPRNTPIILGQIGFFDRFRITFNSAEEFIQID